MMTSELEVKGPGWEPGTKVRFNGYNGATFDVVVQSGRLDALGTLAVRRDDNGRLVHAKPEHLTTLVG